MCEENFVKYIIRIDIKKTSLCNPIFVSNSLKFGQNQYTNGKSIAFEVEKWIKILNLSPKPLVNDALELSRDLRQTKADSSLDLAMHCLNLVDLVNLFLAFTESWFLCQALLFDA